MPARGRRSFDAQRRICSSPVAGTGSIRPTGAPPPAAAVESSHLIEAETAAASACGSEPTATRWPAVIDLLRARGETIGLAESPTPARREPPAEVLGAWRCCVVSSAMPPTSSSTCSACSPSVVTPEAPRYRRCSSPARRRLGSALARRPDRQEGVPVGTVHTSSPAGWRAHASVAVGERTDRRRCARWRSSTPRSAAKQLLAVD